MDTTAASLRTTADWHFLGLPDATVVATRDLHSTYAALADVVEKRAIMCVYGEARSGKTRLGGAA